MLIIRNVVRFRISCHPDVCEWLKDELNSKNIYINRRSFYETTINERDITTCFFECEANEEDLNALIDSLREYHKGVISLHIYTTKDWTQRE